MTSRRQQQRGKRRVDPAEDATEADGVEGGVEEDEKSEGKRRRRRRKSEAPASAAGATAEVQKSSGPGGGEEGKPRRGPESERRPPKRSKEDGAASRKKKKKKERKSEGGSSHETVGQNKALRYLDSWLADRRGRRGGAGGWKFEKCRQIWLLQHCYDARRVPDDKFDALLEYMDSIRGRMREAALGTYAYTQPGKGKKAGLWASPKTFFFAKKIIGFELDRVFFF